MVRQYGAPKDQFGKKGPGYGEQRRDAPPEPKEPDPMPPPDVVNKFHTNADVDKRPEAMHHTLGIGTNQASPGPHKHDGSDSTLLLEGVTISGSRGGNAALLSVINALVLLGAKDTTT